MSQIKIKIEDIILEAFIESIDDYHNDNIKQVKNSGQIVTNKYFWDKPQFVSIDYIDKYNNIVYKETQCGTDPSDSNHIITLAFPYIWYKPFHDKYLKIKNRSEILKLLSK